MKQHITVKQLDELDKKGRKNLGKWWKPEWWHLFVWTKEGKKGIDGGLDREAENMLWTNYTTNPKDSEVYKYIVEHKKKGWILPILSIGQMIEFLGDHDVKFIAVLAPLYGWSNGKKRNLYMNHKGAAQKQLCDALWEAVKEVLK